MLSIKNQEIEKKEKRHNQIKIVSPILFELLTEYILFDRKDKKKKSQKSIQEEGIIDQKNKNQKQILMKSYFLYHL